MPEDYFGEPVARSYDEDEAEMFAADVVAPAVDVLAELAGDGTALEFGIGTGRIALPLSRRGVPVHEERWSGWTREPFTADSTSHVSVWRKTD